MQMETKSKITIVSAGFLKLDKNQGSHIFYHFCLLVAFFFSHQGGGRNGHKGSVKLHFWNITAIMRKSLEKAPKL